MIYDTWKAFELDSASGRNFKELVYITMWVKLNSDSIVSFDDYVGGVGVAIRKDGGNLLWGATLPLSFVSAFEAEAIALWLGLLMEKGMGATEVVLVELDSQCLFNVVSNRKDELWHLGNVLQDIYKLL